MRFPSTLAVCVGTLICVNGVVSGVGEKKSRMSVASKSPSESGGTPKISSSVFKTLTVERCRIPR